MTQLVFMLEEPSAKILLDHLLPRVLPPNVSFLCIPHEGKQDLEKSIPIKLKSWNVPDSWFVVIRDKDQGDCVQLKQRLKQLCIDSHRPETLVRIVVHELESWFLGDLAAVGAAFDLPKLSGKQQSKKFRNPDALANAQEELKKLVKNYQKMAGARKISPHLSLEANTSLSFQNMLSGLQTYLAQIETA
ncbi:DUF4276 family protein [Endozoicomonas ascidiicola]|uniref:DUF4276 family protein n=1 Tax=Endozoicomonas ascidiicola TaxID=1698521 RepID=UPI000833C42E|nr:DUF4276 family protein [Endozoicomonas ascidiicola]